ARKNKPIRKYHPAMDLLEDRTLLSISLQGIPDWTELGPGPITGVDAVEGIAGQPSTGAIQAIAVDPNDPTGKTVFVGAVNGGVWKTTDVTDPNPTWIPLTDQFPSLAIGALAVQKFDDGVPMSQRVIYAGTGNFSSSGRRRDFDPGVIPHGE